MSETIVTTTYFSTKGEENTERTLAIAKQRADQLGIRSIVVASTRGGTGAKAAELFRGYNLVVVSHSTGLREPDVQWLTEENRAAITSCGGKVLTGTLAFGGISGAMRSQMETRDLGDIIANTLRVFGQGMKVVCEMALMAADAGLIRCDEEAIVIAGTGRGADTAVVLKPANAHQFFSLRVREVLCKPRET